MLLSCVTACTADQDAVPTNAYTQVPDPLLAIVVNRSVAVRSINANDVDFSDLAGLKAAIGNARVVMLGEQSHADGTTFQAKVRLIKFLHQEMGFSVMSFEAGMYDVHKAWTQILAGTPPVAAARQSIFEIWSYSQEVQPLFEYIGAQSHTSRPLELAGFDPQFTGPIGGGTGATFISDLEQFLTSHGSTLTTNASWTAFRAVANHLALQDYRTVAPTAAERDAFTLVSPLLQAETAALRNASPSFETSYWSQLTDALDAQARGKFMQPPGSSLEVAELSAMVRDSSMARNVLWLANNAFPDRKIIVWAASAHIANDLANVITFFGTPLYNPQYRPMGGMVRERLGPAMYSIAFIAGGGMSGAAGVHVGTIPAPVNITLPLPGSWDNLYLYTPYQLAFLDFRGLSPSDAAIAAVRRRAGALSYGPHTASWAQMYDGFFFTAEMKPAQRAP